MYADEIMNLAAKELHGCESWQDESVEVDELFLWTCGLINAGYWLAKEEEVKSLRAKASNIAYNMRLAQQIRGLEPEDFKE